MDVAYILCDRDSFNRGEHRLSWLNPETGMYLGYCLHVAGDEMAQDTPRAKMAALEVQRLFNRDVDPDSADDHYLTQARTIIVSYAGAISRHKKILLDELAAAKLEHDGQRKKMIGGRIFSMAWAVGAKVGMIGLFFALGFSLARTIVPFIPEEVRETTGNSSPSVLMGFTTVVIGTLISMLWGDHKQAVVMNRYNTRVDLAWEHYLIKRLEQYRIHIFDLSEAWQDYTGHRYVVVKSIESQLEDDLEVRKALVERRKLLLQGPLAQAIVLIKSIKVKRPPQVEQAVKRMVRRRERDMFNRKIVRMIVAGCVVVASGLLFHFLLHWQFPFNYLFTLLLGLTGGVVFADWIHSPSTKD